MLITLYMLLMPLWHDLSDCLSNGVTLLPEGKPSVRSPLNELQTRLQNLLITLYSVSHVPALVDMLCESFRWER